jgi:hypothetical protein
MWTGAAWGVIWGIISMKKVSIFSCHEKEASLSNGGGDFWFFTLCDEGLF